MPLPFNRGDRVIVVAEGERFNGQAGSIVGDYAGSGGLLWRVQIDGDMPNTRRIYYERELRRLDA